MTVFKTILKIMIKEKFQILLYTGIIIFVCIMNQTSNTKTSSFEESKTNLVIINNYETSEIVEGFTNYLSKISNLKEYKNMDDLNDALFYREVDYVIYLSEDFSTKILNGEIPTLDVKKNGDANSTYSEMIINKYIKLATIYSKYYSGEELTKKIEETLSNDYEIELKSKLDTSVMTKMTSYFNFVNYAYIAALVYVICIVLADMKEKNINKRNNISSYKPSKFNKDLLLANGLFTLFMWLIYTFVAFMFFKENLFTTNGLMYLLNSFIFAFNCLTLGLLIGNIVNTKEAIGGLINVLAIGTSFLSGCFVPVEYMPEGVVNFSKIFPSHWFVNSNNLIGITDKFDNKFFEIFIPNSIIIIAFSILFIVLTNIISKKKMKIN